MVCYSLQPTELELNGDRLLTTPHGTRKRRIHRGDGRTLPFTYSSVLMFHQDVPLSNLSRPVVGRNDLELELSCPQNESAVLEGLALHYYTVYTVRAYRCWCDPLCAARCERVVYLTAHQKV